MKPDEQFTAEQELYYGEDVPAEAIGIEAGGFGVSFATGYVVVDVILFLLVLALATLAVIAKWFPNLLPSRFRKNN